MAVPISPGLGVIQLKTNEANCQSIKQINTPTAWRRLMEALGVIRYIAVLN
jgi:hypothetical protein